ncbi:hypothetical protein T03_5865 [Trichinella britovi]|uniref:Uncharacterized protein n=1 Tax=Trichinella britovi TaxID=45882 RepID=A0A0V1C4L3_TRIBR|nr:hypothetical protein T03_5865 [Trichinella britovi]
MTSKKRWDYKVHIRSWSSSTPIRPLSFYRPLREFHRPQGLWLWAIPAAANEPATSLPSRSTASGTSASGKNAVAISILIFSLFLLHEGTWFAIQDLLPSSELLGRNESSSLGRGPPETIPALQG